jgi:uncharacterized membrane protein
MDGWLIGYIGGLFVGTLIGMLFRYPFVCLAVF